MVVPVMFITLSTIYILWAITKHDTQVVKLSTRVTNNEYWVDKLPLLHKEVEILKRRFNEYENREVHVLQAGSSETMHNTKAVPKLHPKGSGIL